MSDLTQREMVLKLLKRYPNGINTVWVRERYLIVDVPTRIFELKARGWKIDKRLEKINGTATYFLDKNASTPIVEPQRIQYEEVVKDGYTFMRPVEKPVQQELI